MSEPHLYLSFIFIILVHLPNFQLLAPALRCLWALPGHQRLLGLPEQWAGSANAPPESSLQVMSDENRCIWHPKKMARSQRPHSNLLNLWICYLICQNYSADETKLIILRWKFILDYLGEPSPVIESLKMEEGSHNHREIWRCCAVGSEDG